MKRILAGLGTTALLAAVCVAPAAATNGMDMIGYGTRSIGMGGADVAVAGDAGNVSGNPAAVAEATPNSANIGLTLLMPKMSLKHDVDGPGAGPLDSVDGEAQYFTMPQLGYVHSIGGGPVALGIGLYAQGGMGVDFQGVNTGMGTTDELTSQVSFLRVNPILSYKITPEVTLGATVLVGYSQCQFSVYPGTYSVGPDGKPGTGDDFGGMDVTGLSSMGFAGRVGAQVKLGPMVRLGAMYTSESTIKLDGGNAKLNFGQAKVNYDAEMQDFTWPQEVEAGIAVTPAKGLTVAFDVKWINWSATIDQPKLKISNPDATWAPTTPFGGGTTDTQTFAMSWNDQWVYAIGAEYAFNETFVMRAGYNYGKSPVPDGNLNPLFPATVEQHLTLGCGLNLGKWIVNLAYEHAFENTQVNNNTDQSVNMFGPGLEVSHSQNTVSLETTYRY
jgi:long-chain fatty acid transport protein